MTERSTPEQRRERANLDPRFGKIGISAVAAALRYKSEPFNTAYASPKAQNRDESNVSMA